MHFVGWHYTVRYLIWKLLGTPFLNRAACLYLLYNCVCTGTVMLLRQFLQQRHSPHWRLPVLKLRYSIKTPHVQITEFIMYYCVTLLLCIFCFVFQLVTNRPSLIKILAMVVMRIFLFIIIIIFFCYSSMTVHWANLMMNAPGRHTSIL